MRHIELTESKFATVELSDEEAEALSKVGARLASDATWWGSEPGEDGDAQARSVLEVSAATPGRWRVRVRDAVGVIALGSLQLEVLPKIPTDHLLYLMEAGSALPRLDDTRASLAKDQSLWRLVIKWFLSEAEQVLRRDLMRGYQTEEDTLRLVRGRLDPLGTARAYYQGRLEYPVEFDEFTTDIPINRVLRAAAALVAGSRFLESNDRKRALATIARMEDVGELQPTDLRARTSRTTAHYEDALALARQVIAGHGRTLQGGSHLARTFLLRTPEPVEAGIRAILRTGLRHRWSVEKQGRQVQGSKMTFNPDLVFGDGLATGDVKYKLSGESWKRSDLYQAIAFATIYRTDDAAIIGFQTDSASSPRAISVGDLRLRHIDWQCASGALPIEAGERLVASVAEWLQGIPSPLRQAG